MGPDRGNGLGTPKKEPQEHSRNSMGIIYLPRPLHFDCIFTICLGLTVWSPYLRPFNLVCTLHLESLYTHYMPPKNTGPSTPTQTRKNQVNYGTTTRHAPPPSNNDKRMLCQSYLGFYDRIYEPKSLQGDARNGWITSHMLSLFAKSHPFRCTPTNAGVLRAIRNGAGWRWAMVRQVC